MSLRGIRYTQSVGQGRAQRACVCGGGSMRHMPRSHSAVHLHRVSRGRGTGMDDPSKVSNASTCICFPWRKAGEGEVSPMRGWFGCL